MQLWLMDDQGFDEYHRLLNKDHVLDSSDSRVRGGSKDRVINVHGPLLPRSDPMTEFFGLTTYSGIDDQLSQYEEDLGNGETVYLDIDSGGGNGNGLFALGDRIQASNLNVVAYVSGRAASAAYVIAGACSEILCQQGSEVGGLGVITGYLPAEQKPVNLILSEHAENKIPDRDSSQAKANELEAFMYQKLIAWGKKDKTLDKSLDIKKTASDYGNGSMFRADEAKERGMVNQSVLLSPYNKVNGKDTLKNYSEDQLQTKLDEQKNSLEVEFNTSLDTKVNEAVDKIHTRYEKLLSSEAGAANPLEALKFAKDTRFSVEEAEEFLTKLAPAKVEVKEEGDALSDAMNAEGSADLSTLKDEDEAVRRAAKLKADKEQKLEDQAPTPKYGSEIEDTYKLAMGEFEGGLEAYEKIYGEMK